MLSNLQSFTNGKILTIQLNTVNRGDLALYPFSCKIFDQFFDDLIFNRRKID